MTALDVFAPLRDPRPFPLDALLIAARETSIAALALRLGISGSTVSEARAHGMTWRQADTWACRIGRHPSEVWPVTWWSSMEPDGEGEAHDERCDLDADCACPWVHRDVRPAREDDRAVVVDTEGGE